MLISTSLRLICGMDLELIGQARGRTGFHRRHRARHGALLAAEGAKVSSTAAPPARVEEAVGAIVDAVNGAEVRGVAADLGTAAGARR